MGSHIAIIAVLLIGLVGGGVVAYEVLYPYRPDLYQGIITLAGVPHVTPPPYPTLLVLTIASDSGSTVYVLRQGNGEHIEDFAEPNYIIDHFGSQFVVGSHVHFDGNISKCQDVNQIYYWVVTLDRVELLP